MGVVIKRICVALLVGCLAACHTLYNPPEPGRSKTYSGVFLSAFEMAMFLPDGLPESWWLSSDAPPLITDGGGNVPGLPNGQVSRITVEGIVTEKGIWGHGGTAQRELKSVRIIKQAPISWDAFRLAECNLPTAEFFSEKEITAREAECGEIRKRVK